MSTNKFILSDKELWEQFLSGDEKAFKVIYEKYIGDLFYYGSRFTEDEELIKDSIQDLFIDLHRYRLKLGKTNKIMPYLMVSLKRIIVKKLKEESSNKHLNIDLLQFDFVLSEDENMAADKENLDVLQNALDQLTARQREAIYLKYITGLSYEELADVLKMSYQASRNLIYRGMQKLRDCLGDKAVLLFAFFRNYTLPPRKDLFR